MKNIKNKTTAINQLNIFCSQLGFDLFGVIRPGEVSSYKYFKKWLSNSYQADMHWLEKQPEKRRNTENVLSGCRSIIVLGASYFNRNYTPPEVNNEKNALIARYAWGDDYHLVLPEKLKQITLFLDNYFGDNCQHIFYTDTGPILEKALAEKAGLGFVGKNTQLINPQMGSYFFIAVIFTQVDLFDSKQRTISNLSPQRKIGCGSCRRCLDACPTGALIGPKTLDANRCIAYHTVENRKQIPEAIKAKMKNRIFGCDICQEVCPFNRFAKKTRINELKTKNDRDKFTIDELRNMTREEYQSRFKNSAVKRAKFEGLKRNVF